MTDLSQDAPAPADLLDPSTFDADYFREAHPAWEGVDDIPCHRAWRRAPAGTAGTAARHLAGLRLATPTFPDAFPWRYYARLRPCAGAHRWAALDDYVREGFERVGEQVPYGADAKRFLVDLARSYAGHRDALAVRAFELAASYGTLLPDERQHLADSHLRGERWSNAQHLYAALLDEEAGSAWTVRNLVRCAIVRRDWTAAEEALDRSRPRFGSDSVWQSGVRDLIDARVDWGMRTGRARYAHADRQDGDRAILEAVASAVRLSSQEERRHAARPPAGRGIVLCANLDDAALRSCRVDFKGRLLDELGIPWTLVPMHDFAAFEAALVDASAAIFFQVPALPVPLRAVLAARARGVATVYEADVPAFDASITPAPIETFRGFITVAAHDELKLAVPLYRAFAGLCDAGLAATAAVAERLAPLVRSGRAFVLEDGPGLADTEVARPAALDASPDRVPSLFLHSTRLLFLSDERGTAGAAVLDALRRSGRLKLTVSGPVKLAGCFDGFGSRIVEIPTGGASSRAALAASSVNLGVSQGCGDDAALVRGWIEAAGLGIPSAVMTGDPLPADMVDRASVLAATTPAGFGRDIECLLEDAGLRRSIGEAARTAVRTRRSVAALAAVLAQALSAVEAGGRDA